MKPQPTGIIVRASAGTGKTHRLAVRCLDLLAAGEPLDGILATTFTRKAAGEIRERILGLLAQADAGSEQALRMLAERITGFDRRRARELLVHAVSRLHRAQIMTIDALAARMALMLGLEIGLTPGWRVLEDLEDQDIRLRALDRVLARGGVREMIPLLHDLHAGAIKASIHDAMLGFIASGERAWRACEGDAAPWDTIPQPQGVLEGAALVDAIARLAETPCTVTTAQGQPNATWARAHGSCIELARAQRWGALLESKLPWAADPDGRFAQKEMPQDMRAAYLPVRHHAGAVLISRHRVRARATAKLIGRFMPEYEAMKTEANALRFDDVPRMLRGAEAGDLAAVGFRLDARFRHILLDEFQDTSSDQFALLEPMVDEVLAGSEDGRSVMIVGDPKQSLYSWRNAAPGLMDVVERRWPERLAHEELRASWRSSPAILGAVNSVFGTIGSNAVLAGSTAAGDMARMFAEHTAMFPDRAGESVVREIGEPAPRSDEEADAPDWVLAAADIVEDIRMRTPAATIGVLTRTGRAAGRIIGVLRGRGIAASAERGTALGDTPAIAAFAAMLTLIDHPGHSQSAYLVSQTPVGRALGLTDHTDLRRIERIVTHHRRAIFADGVSALCLRVMRACASDMDDRGIRRFEQLAEMCEEFDRDPSMRLDVLVRRIWSIPVEDPSASAVRVMTVHAAKGLEFDAVVLPELSDRWAVRPGDVLMDQPDPLERPRAVSLYAGSALRRVSPELAQLHEATLERRIMDELCALYVGMTRAKSRLEMVVPKPSKRAQEGEEQSITGAAVIRSALGIGTVSSADSVLWRMRHGTEEAEPRAPAAVESSTPAERAPARFVVRAGVQPVWRADRTTPSARASHARRPLAERAELGGNRYGEMVHAWFARIGWLEDGMPEADALMGDPAARGIERAIVEGAVRQFQASVRHGEIGAMLSRTSAGGREPGAIPEVRAELPFLVRRKGSVVSGRMDRVTIGWRGAEARWAEIIDFKTDAPDPANPDWVRERTEIHRPQMEAYRAAVADMVGLDPGRVRIALVFTGVPAIAWIEQE